MIWWCLLWIPLLTCTVSSNSISCDNIGRCSCDYVTSGINLKCAQNGQTSLHASLSSKTKSFQISCNHFAFAKELNSSIFDDLLELKVLNSAQTLSFQFCPLPGESFRSFATLISMIRVNKIKFEYSSNPIKILSPPYLDNLLFLEELAVTRNSNISELHMDLFQGTPNLKSLFLRANAISELYPGVFQHIRKLEVLDLGQNNITHLDPGLFRNLTSLRILNIDHNQIENLTRQLFNSIPHLESLDMSHNRVKILPVGVFDDLWDLRTLQASKNVFITFPSYLFANTKKLEVVKIIYHKYSLKQLPSHLFSDLPALTNVTFHESNIYTVPADLFRNSHNLQMISFTGNKRVLSLPRTLFQDCKNLVKLDLSDNAFNDLPDEVFTALTNLYELNLSKNSFMHIKKVMFANLTMLTKLNLGHNSIKLIDASAFERLTHLTFLDLTNNTLDFGNSSIQSPLRYCSRLEELHLSYNRIQRVYSDWVTTMTELKILDLRRNKMTSVTLGGIIPESLELDLSHNNITTVILDMSHLVTEPRDNVPRVILNANPLACNCSNYALISYTHVLLEPEVYNSLQPVTDEIKCRSTGDLFNKIVPAQMSCVLSQCPHGCYCNYWPYYKQISVNCSSANLTEMPTELPVSYEREKATNIQLILRNNSIHHLPDRAPQSYELLTELDLSNNSIEFLEAPTYFSRLEKLDLSQNKLHSINASLLSLALTSKTQLALDENPLSCSCDVIDLYSALTDAPKIFSNTEGIVCQGWSTPLQLVNINEVCPHYLRTSITIVLLGLLCILALSVWLRYYRDMVLCFTLLRHTSSSRSDTRIMSMSRSESGKKECSILLPD